MKTIIEYSCGHLGEITLPLAEDECKEKIHWALTRGKCLECYKRERWGKAPDLIRGKRWNGQVYGALRRRYVYIDDERVNISDEQAAALEEYIKKNAE